MSIRHAAFQIVRLMALTAIMAGIVASGVLSGFGEEGSGDALALRINKTVESIWERSDGPVSRKQVDRAWLWGPEPVTTSTEYYPGSPSGLRTLVYYDKGRLDILNPESNTGDEWYAVGGLLVQEMLAGRVQLGDAFFVDRPAPEIPLTGDFGQVSPVTYRTLAPFTSAWQGGDVANAQERQAQPRAGEIVAVHLGGDGGIDPGLHAGSSVYYGSFDDTTNHNIADVFDRWVGAQPYPSLYLLGHPISEPYWVDTVVNGEGQTVLIQAFERRVLTYNPNRPVGWQVESSNAGQHYRAWRSLATVTDPEYMPLAAEIPFGEEVVGSALRWDVDPFMLAAISKVTSSGNLQDINANGGRGLLAVHPRLHDIPGLEALVDPAINADNGARALKFWMPDGVESFDWRSVLANYYTHGNVDWSSASLESFVHNVLEAYDDLRGEHPRLEAGPAASEVWGGVLATGPAAFYDPSYTTPWWERTQQLYASKGVIAASYEPDPDGYYCVRPGYVPGERLRLRANGVTITCTIGDMVADHDLHNWLLVSGWAVELSWSAFSALGLQHYNYVEVDYPGSWAKSVPPIPPPAPKPQNPPPAATQPAPTQVPVVPEPAPGQVPEVEPVDSPPPMLPANSGTEPVPPVAEPEPDPPAEAVPDPTPAP